MSQPFTDTPQTGTAFILSAPSGAGKTTIAREVVNRVGKIRISVSHTTRRPRPRETDGTDYHFVTPERFALMQDEGAFLEAANVHGNWYGTHEGEVLPYMSAGTDVILDIDVQGALIIREKINAVLIFILPPSMEELMRRLRVRDTEKQDAIKRRIENARREISQAPHYDYLVINDDFSRAVADVTTVIGAARMGMVRNREVIDEFIKNNK
jgi:guanylate kinase